MNIGAQAFHDKSGSWLLFSQLSAKSGFCPRHIIEKAISSDQDFVHSIVSIVVGENDGKLWRSCVQSSKNIQ